MRVLSLIAILVGSVFVLGVIHANATSNTLRGSEPAWPKWSRAKPPTTDKMKMKILEEKLAKLGCKLKCTRGARLLTREKSKAAEQFVKFVHFAHETLETPTNASLAHANALKQDVMFYVSDVWQQLAEAEVAMKCCEPPLSATQRKTKYFECERKIINLLTLKKEIERDLAKCTRVLHEYKCDVIYTMNQCPQKPFCRGDQVDFFRYMAEGSKKDCCNEYTCIQKGYGADISSGGLALRPMNTKNKCPDYSAVSSLETLMKHGITTDILRWYGTLCEKVDGCMYIKETNTCV
eukprot:g3300.t1